MRWIALFLFFVLHTLQAQNGEIHKALRNTLKPGGEGNLLLVYHVPEDGYYQFSLEGGIKPAAASTIYYCEYLLELKSPLNTVTQKVQNVASQAQDGDVCDFRTNLKIYEIAGIFHQGEKVEFRILLDHCEVNGVPGASMRVTPNTRVRIRQLTPAYVKDP